MVMEPMLLVLLVDIILALQEILLCLTARFSEIMEVELLVELLKALFLLQTGKNIFLHVILRLIFIQKLKSTNITPNMSSKHY